MLLHEFIEILGSVLLLYFSPAIGRALDDWGTRNKPDGMSFGDDLSTHFLAKAAVHYKALLRTSRQRAAADAASAAMGVVTRSSTAIQSAGSLDRRWFTNDSESSGYASSDSDADDECVGNGLVLVRRAHGRSVVFFCIATGVSYG